MVSFSSLIIFLIFFLIFIYWYRYLLVKEQAFKLCQHFCQQRSWQLLDETIHLTSMKMQREAGQYYIRRVFCFEYYLPEQTRQKGYILMHGSQCIDLKAGSDITKVNHSTTKVIPFPKKR